MKAPKKPRTNSRTTQPKRQRTQRSKIDQGVRTGALRVRRFARLATPKPVTTSERRHSDHGLPPDRIDHLEHLGSSPLLRAVIAKLPTALPDVLMELRVLDLSPPEFFLLNHVQNYGVVVDLDKSLPALPYSEVNSVLLSSGLLNSAGGVSNLVTSIVDKGHLEKVWIPKQHRKQFFAGFPRTNTVVQLTPSGAQKVERMSWFLEQEFMGLWSGVVTTTQGLRQLAASSTPSDDQDQSVSDAGSFDGTTLRFATPLQLALTPEEWRAYRTAFSELDPADQHILISIFDNGHTYESVARRLGFTSAEAVHEAVAKVLDRLRKATGVSLK